jgi:hypothetical protein
VAAAAVAEACSAAIHHTEVRPARIDLQGCPPLSIVADDMLKHVE